MEVVGRFDRGLPRPRVDVVVGTLARLIVACKAAYREPLLDALYQYRRKEGMFIGAERRHKEKRPRW